MVEKKEKTGYKDTLNLPRTKFSMKANLPQREPEMLKKWASGDLYGKILEKYKDSGKSFILHDGPPYANGHIHVGHVFNKLLKDICVKYSTMQGKHALYVPGWDCHGLPVEHQLFKELKLTKHEIDKVDFRRKAYKYAMKFVRIQAKEFQRLGIFGDWENPYLTLTKDYEADILLALADLYEKGFIYKDLKPVNWCMVCETALAEAEVEYDDKVSPSVFVKFRAEKDIDGKPASFVIWTTTPWTLLANVAVALHPDLEYSYVSVNDEIWIMASSLVNRLIDKAGIKDHKVVGTIKGSDVPAEFKNAKHPFIDRESAIVLADYVTEEDGTGCVHTAPGHGQDDFITGKKYGLPVLVPVDDKGKFKSEAGEFSGLDITEANPAVIEKMRANGALIHEEKITHSYPHCWRCKDPIIFRATEQWFMRIDHNGLRESISKAIDEKVKWTPSAGRERMSSMINGRPDWCLSRQRLWGVPIPAFKCSECGETFTGADIIRDVAGRVRDKGSNVWFEENVSSLMPEGSACAKCGNREFSKEEDILDVWFDSGVSHKAVLEAREDLSFPADMYLEGSDQHRGWFQSALITSMALNGQPPYREVLTHGFVVDGEGKKMSKSLGNVISPEELMKKYGADILRLWVTSSDYEGDIKLSSEILERLADGYRKIRNTFRFMLSNLNDFDRSGDAVDVNAMNELDRWMLSRLCALIEDTTGFYEKREFHKVYRAVYDFCVYEVSSFYLDVLKDVLYIEAEDSDQRRAAQTVIFNLLYSLVRVLAPVLPFTMEEVWEYIEFDKKEESVHMALWPDVEKEMSGWRDTGLESRWEEMLTMRDSVMKALELKREEGLIGNSLDAAVSIYSADEKTQNFMRDNISRFSSVFKVSQAVLLDSPVDGMETIEGTGLSVGVEKASGEKCLRCWNFNETVGNNADHPDLCERCHGIILKRRKNGD